MVNGYCEVYHDRGYLTSIFGEFSQKWVVYAGAALAVACTLGLGLYLLRDRDKDKKEVE